MKAKAQSSLPVLTSIGVDIGKDVFHIVGFSVDGKIALRRKIKRLDLVATFEKLPPCIVGMEACLSAHFVSRTLRSLGHEPRIIPAIYVKPFVKGQKNDYNDAEAIAEAALRPNLRIVREKTQDQLDLQACHRVRSRLVSRRTATINQIRAFLIDQGITVRAGAHALRKSLFEILKNRADEISPRMSQLIVGLYEDWLWLDERIETVTKEIEDLSQFEANCRRLMSIPGIGPPDLHRHGGRYRNGRGLRARAGLWCVAGPCASAIQHRRQIDPWPHLQAWEPISAHAIHSGGEHHPDATAQMGKFSFGPWLKQAAARLHRNKAVTALANKLARIAWSVLRNDRAFDLPHSEVEAV